MRSKRLFSRDPSRGITKWFHYDDDMDQCWIETTQDVEPILEASKAELNSHGPCARWGEGRKVANIPAGIYAKWCAEGKLGDQDTIRSWINDPANANFRTFKGRV